MVNFHLIKIGGFSENMPKSGDFDKKHSDNTDHKDVNYRHGSIGQKYDVAAVCISLGHQIRFIATCPDLPIVRASLLT